MLGRRAFRRGVSTVLDHTLGLSEDQKALQEAALQFARTEIKPHAREWNDKKIFPLEALTKAANLGFAGVYSEEKYGGSGLGRLDGSIIFEALATGCPNFTAFLTVQNMCNRMICDLGNDSQKEKWLPALNTLQIFAAYCLTEPNSGSDAGSLATTAVSKGDDFVLNGSKVFITGASQSDIYLTMCRTGAKEISCVVVPKDAPGLSFGKDEAKMGWNTHPTTTVMFQDCKVPKCNLLGAQGYGFKAALKGLAGGRINIASCSLGGAWSALERSLQYMSERKQFGKLLKEFQHLQFQAADCATELTASRLLVREAARMYDASDPQANVYSSMAKRYATEACYKIADVAIQLHGGYGYLKEYEVERLARDLRVHRILEGTNEIMRVIIARDLFGA